MKQGLFVTLEGLDGAGKTTQIQKMVSHAKQWGIDTVTTREPGGTEIGNAIRGILLDPEYNKMVSLTEAFLYAASRTQLVHEVIAPALSEGKLVICDRFVDSSLAYQVAGGHLDWEFVWSINQKAVQGCFPDRTFVLDLHPKESQVRRGKASADRMEMKPMDYHQRVRNGFLQLAERFPERICVIDAGQSPDKIFTAIWKVIAPQLEALR